MRTKYIKHNRYHRFCLRESVTFFLTESLNFFCNLCNSSSSTFFLLSSTCIAFAMPDIVSQLAFEVLNSISSGGTPFTLLDEDFWFFARYPARFIGCLYTMSVTHCHVHNWLVPSQIYSNTQIHTIIYTNQYFPPLRFHHWVWTTRIKTCVTWIK